MGRSVRGLATGQGMRAPTESGQCEGCGRTVVVDHARDEVAHAEPVCASFERMMSSAGRRDGVAAVRDPWGRIVPRRAGT